MASVLVISQFLGNLWLAFSLSSSIRPHAPHLSDRQLIAYSYYVAAASRETDVDPYLVMAVMWHESRFLNLPRNSTNDYGLMQVHWQPPASWLDGLTPEDLMNPRINIFAGARELAAMRRFCAGRGHSQSDHYWWGHYRWGVVVLDPKYAQNVLWRQRALRSALPGT